MMFLAYHGCAAFVKVSGVALSSGYVYILMSDIKNHMSYTYIHAHTHTYSRIAHTRIFKNVYVCVYDQ